MAARHYKCLVSAWSLIYSTSMVTVEFSDTAILRQLAGDSCSNLKIIEESTGARCSLKGNGFELHGEKHQTDLAAHVIKIFTSS